MYVDLTDMLGNIDLDHQHNSEIQSRQKFGFKFDWVPSNIID